MSRTTTVSYGGRWFWAVDDAFAVWFAYLTDEIISAEPAGGTLSDLAAPWRLAAALPDNGVDVAPLPEQLDERAALVDRLLAMTTRARSNVLANGDLTRDHVAAWLVVDDLAVSGGFLRAGDSIAVERILEVADGFLSLLTGTLPDDPPSGAWLLGTGRGHEVLPLLRH